MRALLAVRQVGTVSPDAIQILLLPSSIAHINKNAICSSGSIIGGPVHMNLCSSAPRSIDDIGFPSMRMQGQSHLSVWRTLLPGVGGFATNAFCTAQASSPAELLHLLVHQASEIGIYILYMWSNSAGCHRQRRCNLSPAASATILRQRPGMKARTGSLPSPESAASSAAACSATLLQPVVRHLSQLPLCQH
jgi:hypothetical protein